MGAFGCQVWRACYCDFRFPKSQEWRAHIIHLYTTYILHIYYIYTTCILMVWIPRFFKKNDCLEPLLFVGGAAYYMSTTWILPCHAVPRHAALCHDMSCYAMRCRAMPWYAMPWYAMPCHGMPCHAMVCHAMP